MEKTISTAKDTNNALNYKSYASALSDDMLTFSKNKNIQLPNSELEIFSSASIKNTMKETQQLWKQMDDLCSNQLNSDFYTQFEDLSRSETQNNELNDQEHLNQVQHNPSLGNSTKSDSDKEIASGEQVQIGKHCVETLSHIIQPEYFEESKPRNENRIELHLRSDVINKTLLRAVKRYYFKKFKVLQKSMVNKRFKNVKTKYILDALSKFCKQQFQCLKHNIDYRLFAEFMMLFFDIKPSSTKKFNESMLNEAKLTLDCLRKYSYEKFRNLRNCVMLKIMIVKMYDYDLEELFSSEKVMRTNRERYIEAIEEIINNN